MYEDRSVRGLLALALSLSCAVLIAGCGLFDSGNESPVTGRHRGSPDSLLQYLATFSSTPHRDLAAMDVCMHPDFRFYFGGSDRAARPDLVPASWPADLYRRTMQAMSDRSPAISVQFAIHDTVPVMPPTSADSVGELDVMTQLAVVDSAGSLYTTFLVNGLARIAFARDPADSTQWTIASITDRTGEPPDAGDTEPSEVSTTWGSILTHFRAPGEGTDRDTAESLVSHFSREVADPNRDPVEVASCLHPDFRFYLTPQDRSVIGEEFWSRTEFMTALANLLYLSIAINQETSIEDSLGSQPCEPEGAAVCDHYLTVIALTDVVPHPAPPHEVTTFRVHGRAELVVTADPAAPSRLVIREIRDLTDNPVAPADATQPATWGAVLSLFR